MAYILRYSHNPEGDLEKGYSYHQLQELSNYNNIEKWVTRKGEEINLYEDWSPLEIAANELDIDIENLEVTENGFLLQKLNGLMGFELEANNLEDAIDEANNFWFNHVYNSKDEDMKKIIAIFSGKILDLEEEGAVFEPIELLYTVKNIII